MLNDLLKAFHIFIGLWKTCEKTILYFSYPGLKSNFIFDYIPYLWGKRALTNIIYPNIV